MEQGYIIAYNSRFTNNNPHTVINKEAATNRRTWMDFNARYMTRMESHTTSQDWPPRLI